MSGGAKPGEYVLFTVSDTGEGIPPDIVDKIFDPFLITEETGKGTGLGLATVKSIVESHGGFLSVESTVGQGTSFRVYLPSQHASATAEAKSGGVTFEKGTGEQILGVDDEAGLREITAATLEASGYRAIVAGDGTEALATYAKRRDEIAVVVTDMIMPFLDGAATIRALRKMRNDLPVIAISGTTESLDPSLRVDSFISKPFTSEALLKAISAALHR